MWKKAHILYLIIIYRQIIWFWGGLARLVGLEYLTEIHSTHSAGQVITLFTQSTPDYFFHFLWSKGQNFFPTLGGQIIYFIYKNCQTARSEIYSIPTFRQVYLISSPSWSLSSKSSGRNWSVIFRYKLIRHVWHTGDDKK